MSEEPGDDEPTPEPAEDADTDGSDGGDGDSDDFTFPVQSSDGSGADEPDRDGADREQTAADSDRAAAEREESADDAASDATGPGDAASDDGDRSGASHDHVGDTPEDATVDLSERWSADPADRDTADPFAGDADVGAGDAADADAVDGDTADADTADDAGDGESPGTDGADEDDGGSPQKVNHAPFGKAGTPDDPDGETRDQRPGADADELEGGRDDAAGSEPPYDHTSSTTESGSARPDDARATAASDGAGATAGDGGTATGAGGTTSTGGASETGGSTLGGHVSTPPDDEELPLTEHIEEMLSRLGIVVVVAALATLAVVPFSGELIGQIWYDVHPGVASGPSSCLQAPQQDSCTPPHVYGPFEFVLMRIKIAGLAGLLVALPLVVYQTYRFMRPGLYPKERRYYLASVPFSLVLGAIGMLFSYFVILPLLFEYFITYTEGSAEAAFALSDTMGLVLVMLGMTAVIFQIPLFIMLAIMMGLVTREWLEGRRIYFWGLFLGVAFLFGPDPTGMAPVLLTGTMIVLFEATLLLLRWTGR